MKTNGTCLWTLCRLIWLGFALVLARADSLAANAEETFAVLQIGTRTYTNVTVTTKARDYIFIVHSEGMTNVRIPDLPDDIREQLGYNQNSQASQGNGVSNWAKQALGTGDMQGLEQAWRERSETTLQSIVVSPILVAAILGASFLIYLFFCYCAMLICRKTGKEPGALIWLPVLQMFPLLRAAGMSPIWFLAFLLPVLNILAQIVWSVKIADARGKSGIVALFLFLPLTNLFAFLYLAFSDRPPKKERSRMPEIMTLETA
jgi:hypothetical protein